MVMGCASTKSSHVTTTVEPVVEVCPRVAQNEVIKNGGLEPPPVVIEGERPPPFTEEIATNNGNHFVETVTNVPCRLGNETTAPRDDLMSGMREVQLVAPATDINGSAVSVTLTTDEIDDKLNELIGERTPVKVVVKQTTDWMKCVTSAENEFQKIAERNMENSCDILHFEPKPTSSSESSSANSVDEFADLKINQEIVEMEQDKSESIKE